MPNSPVAEARNLWSRPLVWCLILPLVFFSMNGYVPFVESPYYVSLFANQHTSANGVKVLGECAIVFGIIAAAIFPTSRIVFRAAISLKYITLLAGYAVLSTLWSNDPFHTFAQSVLMFPPLLFAYYLAHGYELEDQIALFQTTGAIALTASFAFVQLVPIWGLQHGGDYEGTWRGIFHHKNECAANLTILLISPTLNMRPRTWPAFGYRLASIAAGLFFIFKTQSRAGWLLVAIYLAIHACLSLVFRFRRSELPMVLTLTCVAAVATVAVIALNYQSVAYFLGKDPTFTGRTMIWEATLTALRGQMLLGSGYEAFWHSTGSGASYIFAMAKWSVTNAHNGVLDLLLQLGIGGVILFSASILKALKDGIYCLRNGPPVAVQWYLEIIIVVVGTSLTESTLLHWNTIVWFMYILACAGLHFTALRLRNRARTIPLADATILRYGRELALKS